MRIIALSTVKAFLNRSPASADARERVLAWFYQVREPTARDSRGRQACNPLRGIRRDGRAVFYIAGNKYRILVCINYPYRIDLRNIHHRGDASARFTYVRVGRA